MSMDEKRNSRRLDLDVTVELERIDDTDGVTTLKLVHVDITDLSKSGIGFVSKAKLAVGSYYNTKLQIWTKESIEAVIKKIKKNIELMNKENIDFTSSEDEVTQNEVFEEEIIQEETAKRAKAKKAANKTIAGMRSAEKAARKQDFRNYVKNISKKNHK